tara:strand:+ start:390 stop:1166 length:777 start_codon:yes stop_codon:yes gene_type:complete
MTASSTIVFDFDGVLIDGMHEYWWSSRKACLNLLNKTNESVLLPHEVPQTFKHLRPWVHHGWEMVLIAAEITTLSNSFDEEFFQTYTENYEKECIKSLNKWGWEASQLQATLDNIRREAISQNTNNWLHKHIAFPGVVNRLKKFSEEGLELTILTTKGINFTYQILQHLGLKAQSIYGHESGSKKDVLIKLSKKKKIQAFIEDRRATLETVKNSPELRFIPCYLASWGYIKPDDLKDLPSGIKLLRKKNFEKPFSNWT